MRRALLCFLPLCAAIPACALDADSSAYCAARDRLAGRAQSVSARVLQAADELAAAGLYRDALAILTELVQAKFDSALGGSPNALPEQTAAPSRASESAPVGRGPSASWRVTGAVDYIHWEDLASIADTSRPETRDSLARLLENPFIVSSKAALSLKNPAPFITAIDPSLYVSNQKAALDVSAAFVVAPMLTVEAGMKAEKRLINRIAPAGESPEGGDQTAVFVGDRGDSLDMVGGRTTVSVRSGDDESRARIEAPLTLEAVRYRGGRAGYYSYNDFRAAPAVSIASADMRSSASLRAVAQFKDYKSGSTNAITRADSFDIYRVGPEISGEFWRGGFSGSGTFGYRYEHYLYRGIPYESRSAEAEAQVRAKLPPSLEGSINASYNNRSEGDKGRFNYIKDTIRIISFMGIRDTIDTVALRQFDASFRLYGQEAEIAPAFILESLTAFEPELGLDYSGASLSGRAAIAYTTENVPARQYYTLVSSRGFRARADCMGKLTKRIAFYAQAEYQYRRYAPYDALSRTSRNLQVSSGITLK